MNKDIAMQWADALESGEYRQTQNKLRKANDGMCCLGVLCDLHAKATGTEWKHTDKDQWVYDGSDAMVYAMVGERWSGLRCPVTLAQMNDRGDSFQTIAAYIRENWKSL